MKENIISQGKDYISAKQASALFGYTSDYIGQLCREKKLDCKMIGRSWFVTRKSLSRHAKISSAEATYPGKVLAVFALGVIMIFLFVIFRNGVKDTISKYEDIIFKQFASAVSFDSEIVINGESTMNRIANSFSDDVEVKLDNNDTAVVTPIFKDSLGPSFEYKVIQEDSINSYADY